MNKMRNLMIIMYSYYVVVVWKFIYDLSTYPFKFYTDKNDYKIASNI